MKEELTKSWEQPFNLGLLVTGVLACIMAFLTIVGTQGLHGDESMAYLFGVYAGSWFIFYGLAALIPKLFTRAQRKSAVAAFVSFGAGGGVTGSIIAVLLVTHNLGGSPTAVYLDFAIPFTLPWLLGTAFWFLGRAYKRKS